jgi:hypothetical protein
MINSVPDWGTCERNGFSWGDSDSEDESTRTPVRRVHFELWKNEWFEIPRKEHSHWGHWSHNIDESDVDYIEENDSEFDCSDTLVHNPNEQFFEMEYEDDWSDSAGGIGDSDAEAASSPWVDLPPPTLQKKTNCNFAWGDEDYGDEDYSVSMNVDTPNKTTPQPWDALESEPAFHQNYEEHSVCQLQPGLSYASEQDGPSCSCGSTLPEQALATNASAIQRQHKVRSASFSQDILLLQQRRSTKPVFRSRSSLSFDFIFEELGKDNMSMSSKFGRDWKYELNRVYKKGTAALQEQSTRLLSSKNNLSTLRTGQCHP